jgi:hypothetical protein
MTSGLQLALCIQCQDIDRLPECRVLIHAGRDQSHPFLTISGHRACRKPPEGDQGRCGGVFDWRERIWDKQERVVLMKPFCHSTSVLRSEMDHRVFMTDGADWRRPVHLARAILGRRHRELLELIFLGINIGDGCRCYAWKPERLRWARCREHCWTKSALVMSSLP